MSDFLSRLRTLRTAEGRLDGPLAVLFLLCAGVLAQISALPFYVTGSNWSPVYAAWPLIFVAAVAAWSAMAPSYIRAAVAVASVCVLASGVIAAARDGIALVGVGDLVAPTLHENAAAATSMAPMITMLLAPATLLLSYRVSLQHPRIARVALHAAALGGVAIAIVPWVLGHPLTLRADRGTFGRYRGLIGLAQDPHMHAAMLLLSMAILVGAGFRAADKRRPYRATLLLVLAALAMAAILATGSRAGSFVALLSIIPTVVYLLTKRRRRAIVPVVVVGGMVALAVVYLSEAGVARRIAPGGIETLFKLSQVPGLSTDARSRETVRTRVLFIRDALSDIGSQPIWGLGPGGFRRARQNEARAGFPAHDPHIVDNAHNYPLQLVAEFGIPAGLSLMTLAALAWLAPVTFVLRSAAPQFELVAILAAQAGAWIYGMASHPFLLPEFTVVYWATAGFCLAAAEASDDGRAALRQGVG